MASKAKKYNTSYSDLLKHKFMFIKVWSSSVPGYLHKFHCTVCNGNLSLAGGGGNNFQKHSETPGHKKLANAVGVNNLT